MAFWIHRSLLILIKFSIRQAQAEGYMCGVLGIAFLPGCATVAEVRKRGEEFWQEFEFYLSDLLVGLVLDCVLVGLMAPKAVLGGAAAAGGASGRLGFWSALGVRS